MAAPYIAIASIWFDLGPRAMACGLKAAAMREARAAWAVLLAAALRVLEASSAVTFVRRPVAALRRRVLSRLIDCDNPLPAAAAPALMTLQFDNLRRF